jgi:hypothetical protein
MTEEPWRGPGSNRRSRRDREAQGRTDKETWDGRRREPGIDQYEKIALTLEALSANAEARAVQWGSEIHMKQYDATPICI